MVTLDGWTRISLLGFAAALLGGCGEGVVGTDLRGDGDRAANQAALATASWTQVGSLAVTRNIPTSTVLSSDEVLVVGGFNGAYLASAEVYDPDAGTWASTGSLAAARARHSATRLPNGNPTLTISGSA